MNSILKQRLAHVLSPSFQSFLKQNQDSDITKLLLSKTSIDIKEAADQLISRRKAKNKLPDWYDNVGIVFPPPLSVEQSSSQEAAAYKTKLISGQKLVDLTGGMGVDCLALSQHFDLTTYVEKDEWLCTLFNHNQKLLAEPDIQVENVAAEDYLQSFTGKATFFIDPARRDVHKNRVFRFEDCSPDLTRLMSILKEKADKVLIKAAPLMDISLGLSQLSHVKEVHVLSIKNEVKEVLFLLDFSYEGETQIQCVNLGDDQPVFKFKLSEEKEAALIHGTPKRYLYDPNSAVLKAGAFKSVAVHYPVQKISTNTHLYSSDRLIENFPGRRFEILNSNLKKNELKSLSQANVITKNFPLKPEALKKKLGLRDGGEYFVIGYRDNQEKPKIMLAISK